MRTLGASPPHRALLLGLLLSLALGAPSAEVHAQSVEVRGRVTDAESGEPVGGATVSSVDSRVLTDAEGAFSMSSPDGAITVARVGYETVSLVAGTEFVEVRLSPAPVLLDGIVVTAQQREERLIDVPISVAVLTGGSLRQQQVNTVNELARVEPSLIFAPGINDLISSLRVRGVGSVLFNQGLESSVSFVVDGVPLAQQAQGLNDLIDIERVEVLRGPQGTLFGRNATAGVVNVVTRRPDDEFSVSADVTAAEFSEYRVRATATGPFGQKLGGRVTGYHNGVGGHIRNVRSGDNVNGNDSYGARAQLEFNASENLNLRLIGDYSESDQECCQWQAVRADNPLYSDLLDPVDASLDNRSVNVSADLANDSERGGLSLQGEFESRAGRLTSISAFRSWRLSANNDIDSTPTDPPLFGLPFNFGSFDVNRSDTDVRQFSQELRLASDEGRLGYVAGLYYLNVDVDRALTRRVGICPPPANVGLTPGQACQSVSFVSRLSSAASDSENYALFGQVDWDATEALTLLAGLRIQRDEVSYDGTRPAAPAPSFPNDGVLGPTFIGGPAANEGSGSTSDVGVSVRFGAQYRFGTDVQAYLTYTSGYKGPGFDIEPTTDFADQTPVRPETVQAYEAGIKGVFLRGKLGINASAFYQDYTDLQVQASVEADGLRAFVPTNAGSAVSSGFELGVFARPAPAFSLTAALSVLDTDVDADGLRCIAGSTPTVIPSGELAPENSCFRFGDEAPNAIRQNIRGGSLPNAPRYRSVLTGRYEDVSDGLGLRLFAQGSLVTISEVEFLLEQDPLLFQDGYSTVDASFGVGSRDGRYTLSLFVNNVFNQDFASVLLRAPTWRSTATQANINGFFAKQAFRFVGVTLRVAF